MFSHVAPPRPGGDGIPFVRRIKAKEVLDCRICCNEPVWIYTHYTPKTGTTPCDAEREPFGSVVDQRGCVGCKDNHDERMKGYLWILNSTMHRYEFFEVTPPVWFQIQTQANGVSKISGFALTAQRGKADTARITIHLDGTNMTYRNMKYSPAPSPDASIAKLMRKR
jgi:hypothetical protein